MHRETVRSESPVEQAEQEWFPAKDHTILWISRRLQRNQRWRSTFGSADMKVLHADELNLSLEQVDEADIDIILVETSGVTHDDIDLCRRLRQLFDTPLMLIAANVTEAFAVAAYSAGIDECISGHISADLLCAKVNAHIRSIERHTSKPKFCYPKTC